MKIKQKGNAIFDYTKYALAIMIVALHSKFIPNILNPWLRLAVPLFFIISSYFFFKKVALTKTSEEKRKVLLNYVKRNLQLYLFWFIALLPIILYIRRWFSSNIIMGILKMFRDIIFSSTFSASWYLMASVIATVIIFFASKKLSNWVLLGICFVIYLVLCLFSGYSFLVGENSVLKSVMDNYVDIFTLPVNSFPVGLFWVVCGKCFADGTFDKIFKKMNKTVLLIISAALLYVEWRVIRFLVDNKSKDCYLMLIVIVPVIFEILRNIDLKVGKTAVFLRKASTITYAFHCSAIHVLRKILRMVGFEYNSLVFVLILGGCLIASVLIFLLEKKKLFAWLKYSH